MSRFMMARLVIAAALTITCSLFVSPAMAGEYRVYSCMTPSGLPAPTDGWSSDRALSVESQPLNYCAAGGALLAILNPNHAQPANTAIVTWGWSAPSGAAIVGYRIWRSADVRSGPSDTAATPYVFSTRDVNSATASYLIDHCAAGYGCTGIGVPSPALATPNALVEDVRHLGGISRWYINAACGGVTGQWCSPNGVGMSVARVHAAEFTLRDAEGPVVASTQGRLASATTHSGTEQLSFTATDAVSGVYRSILEVDGKIVRTAVISANDGRCADAGVDPASPYEFMYREPCPKSVQHDFALDTRTLTDGTHNVRLSVEDASGNRSSVWSAPEFLVQNASAVGAAGAAGAAGTSGGAGGGAAAAPCTGATSGLTARYRRNGARTLRVRHRQAFNITGRGPANTDIDVFHVRRGKFTALGSFRTSAAGTFTERVSARHGNGTLYLCGTGLVAKLTLKVRAVVSLTVRITRGGLVRYSGRVRTGHIPKGGKIVAIQGKAGPSWQTFALRRTSRTGRFKGRYRLRVVIPGAKLKFRVRVPNEAGYPFVGVVGKSITKRVR
ncbi:MAG: hypothetical protein ACSLFR_09400 [Solirubrobacteraceae bacterium]